MDRPAEASMRVAFGRACREARLQLDVGLRMAAIAAGISPSYLARVERGLVNLTVARLEAIAEALGMRVALDIRGPVVLGPRGRRTRDAVHARCSGYVGRRLRAAGWTVLREVLIVDGSYRGWVDLLAFDPVARILLIIEVKTRLDDIGGVERQVGWYERNARAVAADQGWSVARTSCLLVVLATDENEAAIRVHRDVLDQAFPERNGDLTPRAGPGRSLAMIDPRSRRRAWLMRPIVDGRRSRAPYRDYADAADRLAR